MADTMPVSSGADSGLTVLGVRNPRYADADRTCIDCEVNFQAYGWVPFTLGGDDQAPHIDAVRRYIDLGHAGPVAGYAPPPALTLPPAGAAERLARLEAEVAALRVQLGVSDPAP